MPQFYDRVKVTTTTTGTGSIALGSAVSGFRDFTAIPNGTLVSYAIEDGSAWEIGTGVVSSSGTALTRNRQASSTGALLSLSGAAMVFITFSATDAANAIEHPGYAGGAWYQPAVGQLGAGGALVANSARFFPFPIKQRTAISDLGVRVTTASSGNSVQTALYASTTPAANSPVRPTGACLGSTGNLSTTTAGVVSGALSGGNITLEPGLYWMAVNANNAVVVLQNMVGAFSYYSALVGSLTLANISSAPATANMFLSTPLTFGTWSDVTSATWTEQTGTNWGMVFLKAA